MRRKILVAGVVTALLIAGCGANDASGAKKEDGPVTLSYAIWDEAQSPTMRKIADEFTKANPNVKVDIQVKPFAQYFTALQTAATGGQAPDVFWLNGPNIKLYAGNKQLAPLDEAIKQGGEDVGNYPKALVSTYTVDGKTYGLPKDFDTIGVWYNKALFDQAGVPYPAPGWTWDDYRATAKKLTNPAKKTFGTVAPVNSQAGWYNTIPSAGGEIISSDGKKSGFASPEAAKGVKFWVDLIKDGSSPTVAQMAETKPTEMFRAGQVAMMWNGSWAAGDWGKVPALQGKLGVAPLPAGPKGSVSVIHGLANVVYAKSKAPETAKKFAVFLGGKKAADITAEDGAAIPAYKDAQKAWTESVPGANLNVFLDAREGSVPYPASKSTRTWNAFEESIMTKILNGEQEVDAGLKELAGQMDGTLAKEK